MKTLVEDALAEQDPNCGGWLYFLPRGHCYCERAKHTGMAGFITAVLINGLSRYYLLSGDERLPDAINRGVSTPTTKRLMEYTNDEASYGRSSTMTPGVRNGATGGILPVPRPAQQVSREL